MGSRNNFKIRKNMVKQPLHSTKGLRKRKNTDTEKERKREREGMNQFSRAAIKRTTNWGLGNRNLWSHNSGARSWKASCWQDWFLRRAVRKNPLQALLLGLQMASLMFTQHFPNMHLCVQVPLCRRITVILHEDPPE